MGVPRIQPFVVAGGDLHGGARPCDALCWSACCLSDEGRGTSSRYVTLRYRWRNLRQSYPRNAPKRKHVGQYSGPDRCVAERSALFESC